MPELDSEDRRQLRDEDFAYVDRDGERHLPIHDESHVRNALARWSQTKFESDGARQKARRRILEAARKYQIEVDEDDKIVS